jgi:hypothetical protein
MVLLPPELRKAIERVQIDAKGNVVPQLYSKMQANQELRQMLNIGGCKEQETSDISKLSDAELTQQLADQAKELGIEIDLNYRFAQQPTDGADKTDGPGGKVIDETAQPVAVGGFGADAEEERRAAEAARELKIASQGPTGAPAGVRKLSRNAKSRP